MAQSDAGQSTEDADETLNQIFNKAMKYYENIETTKEPTNSDNVQVWIRTAISKFEKATNLVSISGMFSRNESIEELPTETLQYLLLPALLGSLCLKLIGRSRSDVIHLAEVYFRDFLQRCKDYGVTDVEVPQPSTDPQSATRPQSEAQQISNMVLSREAKIKRYKEAKQLKDKLATLSKAMDSPTIDEETKREYFITLLQEHVNQAIDELSSIEQEKPLLEYMAKHGGEHKLPKHREPARPLRPVMITRDAAQKAVFGAGYPAIPSLTIEEFYDQRVREGIFPGSGTNIPHTTIQTTEAEADEHAQENKERLVETDDPEELERQRAMDEYKDDHRRGWGNRHNRS